MTPFDTSSGLKFLAGGGRMGELMRSKDWAATPLGSPETWPQSLRTSVSTCLNCSFPILIWWGPELVKIYNDAYSEILADKHPWALGRPGKQVWPEIWDTIEPMLSRAMDRGEAAPAEDLLLWLHRRGYPEECYFSFSYSPIRDENGQIVGVFCPVVETTKRVFAERRAKFLMELENALRGLSDAESVKLTASRLLGEELGVAQAGYAEATPDGDAVFIEGEWNDGRMPSTAGLHRLADYGPAMAAGIRAGEVTRIEDVRVHPQTSSPEIVAAYNKLSLVALLNIPLLKDGVLRAVLFAHDVEPRAWTDQEVGYAQDMAERTWSAVERASAEAALRRSEEEFRTLGENLPNLCWMADASGAIYWFNRQCCEFTGKTQEELVAGAWHQLHDAELFPTVMERWQHAVTSGIPFEMTFPLRGADGVMHPFLTRVLPLRDGDRSIRKWFGTNVDISEQQGVEERLRASEAQLRILNDTLEQQVAVRTADRDRMWRLSTDIMLVARFDGEIHAANPAWSTILGWHEPGLHLVSTSD